MMKTCSCSLYLLYHLLLLQLLVVTTRASFTPTLVIPQQQQHSAVPRSLSCDPTSRLLVRLSMGTGGGGDGSDSEWAKALYENSGQDAATMQQNFEKEMKMKGLMKGTIETNPKLSANQKLIQWLTERGEVYLSEQSTWGEAPHPSKFNVQSGKAQPSFYFESNGIEWNYSFFFFPPFILSFY